MHRHRILPILTMITVFCLNSLTGRANAQSETGPWYGSYGVQGVSPDFELTFQVLQRSGSRSADVQIDVFNSDTGCPPAMADSLCAALPPGLSTLTADGVRLDGLDRALIAFARPEPAGLFLARIARKPDGLDLIILHEKLGLQYAGHVRQGPHLCEQVGCSRQVFDALAAAPDSPLGVLRDASWAEALLDRHGALGPRPPETRAFPDPQGLNPQARPQEPDENDLPGFGVYAFEYTLRGLLPFQTLPLRVGPNEGARVLRQLEQTERGLIVFGCLPGPDNIEFDLADRLQREAMLDPLWCDVEEPGGLRGWLPGRHLTPIER